MAVQAQFGGGLAGCMFPYGGFSDEQLQALLSAAAANNKLHPHPQHHHQHHHCPAAGVASAAQSDLTCNGNGNGGFGAVAAPSRKRARVDDGDDLEPFHHHHPSSAAALLPIPGTAVVVPATGRNSASAAASTSGRPFLPSSSDALLAEAELAAAAEMAAEVEAVVRAGCERLRVGLERATRRRCESAALAAAARALREKDAELLAARRRAAELELRLRHAAAEAQAWCALARGHEAAASRLRATLDALLLQSGANGGTAALAQTADADEDREEGCGESAGDAGSRCFVGVEAAAEEEAEAMVAMSSAAAKRWACRGCGEREATVLVLPCRHLCVCKACETRAESCPVCAGDKSAAIHIEPCN